MDSFSVALTVTALLGIALMVLLLERRRATRIEHDLREMAKEHRARRGGTDGD